MSFPVGTSFEQDRCEWRIWAPAARKVQLVLFAPSGVETSRHEMNSHDDGYVTLALEGISSGQRYAYQLDDGPLRPDPASRWQPEGIHKPSAVWRADEFAWSDHNWRGVPRNELVIYELHPGSITREGTFAAIGERLAELRELGITAIEIMPVGQFPGAFGWGYDGVHWFAPQNTYGGPAGLQRLVDTCHAEGLAVLLDVIYNHLGPEGNYLREFGPYFTKRHHTPWGEAINYDGPDARAVRDFVLANVRMWIRDFHFDGLRLDAVQMIIDDSPVHLLAEIGQAAEEEARNFPWPVHVIAESSLNDVHLLDPRTTGGYGLTATWNDDFHHSLHAMLTGESDGYYADFDAPLRQLVKSLNDVFVYDGCFSRSHRGPRGKPVRGHSGDRFVVSIQNHDQVGNRACGERFGTLISQRRQRLAAGLLLLSPHIPLLFMGEEYGENNPFPFFCDFLDPDIKSRVAQGRREEFASFNWGDYVPDPTSRETFISAILSWQWDDDEHREGLRTLYRELIACRRRLPALHDFQLRRAWLWPHEEQGPVLLLTRGNPGEANRFITIVFNLADHAAPLPNGEDRPGPLLLHSDEHHCGGQRDDALASGELPPFAFALFGSSPENPS